MQNLTVAALVLACALSRPLAAQDADGGDQWVPLGEWSAQFGPGATQRSTELTLRLTTIANEPSFGFLSLVCETRHTETPTNRLSIFVSAVPELILSRMLLLRRNGTWVDVGMTDINHAVDGRDQQFVLETLFSGEQFHIAHDGGLLTFDPSGLETIRDLTGFQCPLDAG